MILKSLSHIKPSRNGFELLGDDEVGLSKAFAYLISSNREVLYLFLRNIGVNVKNTENNFRNTQIIVEKRRNEGRTDIEIYQHDKFHVIIECKVGKNRIKEQRTQYYKSFDYNDKAKKHLCFITQEHDYNREIIDDIRISYRGWIDIVDLINDVNLIKESLIKDFIEYVEKRFKMRLQKEILIQDLSKKEELNRYLECNVYRRDVTFGNPLYFAPYFTRNSEVGEGILYLSKVLGVLTIYSDEIENFRDDLFNYADNTENLVFKWINGVKKDLDEEDSSGGEKFTYYFLGDPIRLNNPLMKDQGKAKGSGKGWISRMIPKNRCVTFEEFMKRVVLAEEKNCILDR